MGQLEVHKPLMASEDECESQKQVKAEDKSIESTSKPPAPTSCLKLSFLFVVVVIATCIALYICRGYIKPVLLWIESLDAVSCIFVFTAFFCLVSFPMTWGYILLNVAAGYLYGSVFGILIVSVSAFFGLVVADRLLRMCLVNFFLHRIELTSHLKAMIKVVEGKHWFKVVALSRLTPVPFGVQNVVFAATKLPVSKYLFASTIGLLPTQVLNAYVGSTLRSMEDVLNDESHKVTGWTVFSIQIVLTILLIVYLLKRAQKELNETMSDESEAAETKAEPLVDV